MTRDRADALHEATTAQAKGSDPRRSVFVVASAGSGKTKVLRDRVLRLLLEERCDPAKLLCLTFTKAAAAEMSNRIANTLAQWAASPERELEEDLQELTGRPDIGRDLLDEARRLFARVLDTPGGMRIHTIHAFCQSLLRRFPLEAGIAPHFKLIEERDARELMAQARDDMLALAHSGARPDLAAALARVTERMHEGRIADLISEFQRDRGRLSGLRTHASGIDSIMDATARAIGVEPGEDRETVLDDACGDDSFDAAGLRRAAMALSNGSASDQARGRAIVHWLDRSLPARADGFSDYAHQLLTKEGSIRKTLAGKEAKAAFPGIERLLSNEAGRVAGVLDRLKSIENLEATKAVLTLGLEAIQRYESLKLSLARLDYDDLVRTARDLLGRPGIAPWVLYKLDGGIDHVLIDEAQDTSHDQWRLVVDLTAEYFAGLGAVERQRTLFAVGDAKQSIFSFQGAEPKLFGRHLDYFQAIAPNSFGEVALNVSFRSSAPVLDVVDRVFAGPAGQGVRVSDSPVRHVCSRGRDYGEVRVWPIAIPVDLPLPEPWAVPEIIDQAMSPEARLANEVAKEIQRLIGAGLTRRSDIADLLNPGDIMVLVRNRTQFVDLLVRALKERGVPVAGIDRMHLLEQIAVKDLLAFAEFLLLHEDDLTLAALLKSPLVGLDEQQLFELCADRAGHLWPRLLEMAGSREWAHSASAFLAEYVGKARRMTPHELFADLLGQGRGRRRLYARLGPQCGEAIDEFLGLSIAYERTHAPTLQGFIAWVRSSEMIVKRDLEEAAGQVRIMTVHGAKGLEAPVVFLCDQRRTSRPSNGLFWMEEGDHRLPLWSARKETDGRAAARLREDVRRQALEEENRLLYVAMTRAEERLYVCGWSGAKKLLEKSWHDHVTAVLRELQASGAKVDRIEFPQTDGWDGEALCYAGGVFARPVAGVRAPAVDQPAERAWLHTNAPAPPLGLRPVSPSRLKVADPSTLSPLGADDGKRFKRGRLIHHLLELLPALAPEQREAAAKSYLARSTHGLSGADVDEIAAATLAVLEEPAFACLFSADSLAEVPIVARWVDGTGRYQAMSGRIDRLWVGDEEAWAIDFKSNRPAPLQPEHILPEYRAQMAAYRIALQNLYPDKGIRCFLLWSDGPRLMEIPSAMLEMHGC